MFSTTFCSDSPATVAIAGSRGKVIVWNLESNPQFKKHFPSKQFGHSTAVTTAAATSADGAEKQARKEVTEMESDNEMESDDEGELEGDQDEEMESADEV